MPFGTCTPFDSIYPTSATYRLLMFCRVEWQTANDAMKREIGDTFEASMKSQGEIEAAVCKGIARFEQDYMGRGPKDIHAYLIGDLLVVRLKGVLTVAEQQLVTSLPAEKGRDLLKQVRIQLVEAARPVMEAMIKDITGVKVVSLHHDISTVTGEEVVLFTLGNAPAVRDIRK